jgi:GNAT superfamily N-acetyltransferase
LNRPSTEEHAGIEVVVIQPETWPVFEELFGPDGVEGGCWCSYFKMTSADFGSTGSRGHKKFVKDRLDEGEPFGLVLCEHGEPLAWVAVSPRTCNRRLERSVVAKVEPERDVSSTWSVVCFYGRRRARGRGYSALLLREAIDYARRSGAQTVEGYPVDLELGPVSADERYHGRLDVFLDAGFELVERRGKRRALVRLDL